MSQVRLEFLTTLLCLARAVGLYSTSFWEDGGQDREEDQLITQLNNPLLRDIQLKKVHGLFSGIRGEKSGI